MHVLMHAHVSESYDMCVSYVRNNIHRCVPECLMRLTDTRGEIRAAYSSLLEVVPTHIMTRSVMYTHSYAVVGGSIILKVVHGSIFCAAKFSYFS